jgi:hypothetical protein
MIEEGVRFEKENHVLRILLDDIDVAGHVLVSDGDGSEPALGHAGND